MADQPELSRRIRRLEIKTTRLVSNIFGGEYHSVFKGRGIDFDEVREYQEGDDVRLIDWNVTARMDRLFVKKFVEERELTIMLAVDLSASLSFGSKGRLKRELATEFAAAIALSAMQNHDRVGLFLFSDGPERFVPPRRGRAHVLRMIRDMLVYRPEGRRTRYAESLAYFQKVLTGRAIVFVVSDFIDLDMEGPLKGLLAKHDVIAVTLVDPRELELPDVGLMEVADPETGETMLVDTGSARLRADYARRAKDLADNRSALFRSLGIDELVLRTDQTYVKPLAEFFERRAKRQVRRRRVAL
ncbi:DUF58 domain-containing protein [bacterium]|nr:DUF58 domain-containing protein [bacterium]